MSFIPTFFERAFTAPGSGAAPPASAPPPVTPLPEAPAAPTPPTPPVAAQAPPTLVSQSATAARRAAIGTPTFLGAAAAAGSIQKPKATLG